MSEKNSTLNFNNDSDIEAFARWHLDASVANIKHEFEDRRAYAAFVKRRERRFLVELDNLRNLDLRKPNIHKLKDQIFFRIVKIKPKKINPLSSERSQFSNSRFNFKNVEFFQNNVIYFGQNRRVCFAEIFHLPIQKKNYAKQFDRTPAQQADELPRGQYQIFEYKINLDKVLVLTSPSTFQAIGGVKPDVLLNEWYHVNDEFEIPTSSQILGREVKALGIKALLYVSVRDQTKNNLVVFEQNTGELDFELISSADIAQTDLEI